MPDDTAEKMKHLRREIDNLKNLLPPRARLALAGSILQTVVVDPAATESEQTAATAGVGIIALVVGV